MIGYGQTVSYVSRQWIQPRQRVNEMFWFHYSCSLQKQARLGGICLLRKISSNLDSVFMATRTMNLLFQSNMCSEFVAALPTLAESCPGWQSSSFLELVLILSGRNAHCIQCLESLSLCDHVTALS